MLVTWFLAETISSNSQDENMKDEIPLPQLGNRAPKSDVRQTSQHGERQRSTEDSLKGHGMVFGEMQEGSGRNEMKKLSSKLL
jgi:hypothetical protein